MPVYATTTPAFAERRLRPRTLILIVGGHAALLALAMSARMDLPIKIFDPPIIVEPIPLPPEPQLDPKPRRDRQPPDTRLDQLKPRIPLPPMPGPEIDPPVPIPTPLPFPGPSIDPDPQPLPQLPIAKPVRTGPRFATPDHLLKPPYPRDALDRDEEASLRLRLSIDARGRVTAVDPVGSADPAFLAAARKHLIARWRYKPATEDGRPVASSTVITLRFELEG